MDVLRSFPPGTDLMTIPLAIDPHGQQPDFVNPPSLEHATLVVGIALIVSSGPLLALRLYANLKHSRKLYLDDMLVSFGWICAIAYWSIAYSLVAGGAAGRHAWDTPVGYVVAPSYLKHMFAQTVFGVLNLWIVRSAILVLYMRIFSSIRWMRITSLFIIILSGTMCAASIFISVGYCTPRAGKEWNSVSLARCADPVLTRFSVVSGVFNVLTDCITFALPLPAITGLQIDQGKRIGLFVVFCVTICIVAASCAALAYRIQVSESVSDIPWIITKVIITSTCEQFGIVIVSCVPGLSCFWSKVFTKTRFYSRIRSSLKSRWEFFSADKALSDKADPNRSSVKQNWVKNHYEISSDLE